MKKFFISIIIAFEEVNGYVLECVNHCLALDYGHYEIMLLPYKSIEEFTNSDKIKVTPTGPVSPSAKRNVGIRKSQAEIVAFLDSDAYPTKYWLKNALPYFADGTVGGVGGPNLTPKEDTIWQKASGDIFSSPVGAGKFAVRYTARYGRKERLIVREMPSCNLLARRELVEQIGGFDATLLTGEDAKLCFGIRKTGKKIVYAPDVQIYHHRRNLFIPHLKQVWNYGRDKARIIRDDFSFDKLYYFIPSAFVTSLVAGATVSLFNAKVRAIYSVAIAIYLSIVLLASLISNVKRSFLTFPGMVLTHISYGLGFWCGLLR